MLKLTKYIQVVCLGCVVSMLLPAAYGQEAVGDVGAGQAPEVTNLREAAKRLGDCNIEGLERKVNLETMQAWDVVQLIQFLANRGGLKNIVIGKGVSGLTTKLKFDGITVREALDKVLSINNLAYTVENGVITIMSDAEYQLKYGVSFYDNKQVKICELRYADPTRVASLLAPVKSTIGTVVSDEKTGTIILIDTPAKVREMERIIQAADINTVERILPTVTKAFVLQYADVSEVDAEISKILSKEAGSIRANKKLRTIIVTDLPHKMKQVEQLVALFDRRQKQVFLEAKVIEIVLSDGFEMGVNWDKIIYNTLDPRQKITASITPGMIKPGDSTFALRYHAVAGGVDLSAIVQALKKVGNTKVISNPHVAALDGETATVSVSTDQPYVETRKNSIGDEAVAGTEVKFIPVGVTLDVTPRIMGEMIQTKIHPEVSRADFRNFSYGTDDNGNKIENEVPVVTKSYAETTVMIKNGQTVIIGGMIQDTKGKSEQRVPILGRVPLLGMLFRHTVETTKSVELAIFLTPRIISGEKPIALTKDMKKKPKGLRQIGPSSRKQLKGLR